MNLKYNITVDKFYKIYHKCSTGPNLSQRLFSNGGLYSCGVLRALRLLTFSSLQSTNWAITILKVYCSKTCPVWVDMSVCYDCPSSCPFPSISYLWSALTCFCCHVCLSWLSSILPFPFRQSYPVPSVLFLNCHAYMSWLSSLQSLSIY